MQMKLLGITNVDFDVIGQQLIRFLYPYIMEKKWEYNGTVHQVLLKCGGAHSWRITHELITEIWRTEIMPKEWSVAVIYPIHKKNEKTICSNYRGISLLSVIYKVLSKILAKRLNPYTEQILGDYQCGFRRARSTTDQIFVLKNVL
jgi:hypothetical protein